LSLNKKADFNDLKDIIIVLISFIVLTLVAVYLSSFFTSTGSKKACETWVNLQSTPVLKDTLNLKSSCVTTEITIKNEKKEEIYKNLADNMYDCWDQYGGGDIDFYSDINWFQKDTYCRICSTIKVSSDLEQSRREFDLDDFEKYLANNNPPGHTESYAEFFVRAKNAQLDFGQGTITLDPSTNLYTIFLVNKGADWSKGGIFNKFVVIPGATILGIGQIPGASSGIKGLGGLIKFKSAIPLGGTITKTAPVLGKTGWGLLIIYVASAGLAVAADGSILHPSLTLLPADSPKIQECDAGIYYEPISGEGIDSGF